VHSWPGSLRALDAGFDPGVYLTPAAPFTNAMIPFSTGASDVPHLIRKVGADFDDGICDNSFDNLMNIYSSGVYASPICQWPDHP